MCGCGIERENVIFGSVEDFDVGGNDDVSGNDQVSGVDEVSAIHEESGDGEVSAWARGNKVDSIGLLLDNFSKTGHEMNGRFRLRGSNDRVLKDADS